MTRTLRLWALGAGLLLAAPVVAQEAEPPAAEQAETQPEAAREKFEKAQRLEELRYRHLWLGYGAFWLIVFAFVVRTWQRSRATEGELDDLKARLAALEEEQQRRE